MSCKVIFLNKNKTSHGKTVKRKIIAVLNSNLAQDVVKFVLKTATPAVTTDTSKVIMTFHSLMPFFPPVKLVDWSGEKQ